MSDIGISETRGKNMTNQKMMTATISEFVERYFDCPYCQSLISDQTHNFDGQTGHFICPECNRTVKLV